MIRSRGVFPGVCISAFLSTAGTRSRRTGRDYCNPDANFRRFGDFRECLCKSLARRLFRRLNSATIPAGNLADRTEFVEIREFVEIGP